MTTSILSVFFLAYFFVLRLVLSHIPWSYDTIAVWADVGTQNTSLFSEYQSKFLGETYDWISIEKCLGFVPHYDLIATKLGDALV